MKNRTEIIRNIIVAVCVLCIGTAAYLLLAGGKEEVDTTSPENVAMSAEIEKILGLLQEVNTIHVDAEKISNLETKNLFNFQQEIVAGPRGKVNPFAP